MRHSTFFLAFILTAFLTGCNTQSEQSAPGVPYIDTGIDPDAWVLIPAGSFLKGQHEHETMINYDYEIMITDVTNAQYARFLNEAKAKGIIKIENDSVKAYYPGDPFNNYKHEKEVPAGDKILIPLNQPGQRILYDGNIFSVENGYENHPMVMVSWFGAWAYAKYYGWRLPTENEWEKAARGEDNRVYPWGDEIHYNQANYYSSRNLIQKIFGKRVITTPVGYYNGKTYNGYETMDARSPYGLYDMAGNVWQWCGDDYPYTHLRYMRGGSEANYEYNLRVWARNSAGPEFYSINIGFRCTRDVKPNNDEEQKKTE